MNNITNFPGSSDPKLDKLGEELGLLIDKARGQQITYAAMIGTLEKEKQTLLWEWIGS